MGETAGKQACNDAAMQALRFSVSIARAFVLAISTPVDDSASMIALAIDPKRWSRARGTAER